MAKFEESTANIASKIDHGDLARVEKCGLNMNEATEGKITVSSVKREVLGVKSPALLEQDHRKGAERG